MSIRFGEPIPVDRYRNRIGDRNMYRELTDELMFEIQRLTGLDYDNTYAGSKAEPKVDERPADLEPARSSANGAAPGGRPATEAARQRIDPRLRGARTPAASTADRGAGLLIAQEARPV